MSTRYLAPYSVLSQSVSSTNSYVSSSTNVAYLDNISYMPRVVSGTPSGTFDVQVSHDNTIFTSLTLSAVPTITSGSLSNVPIALEGLPFPYVRIVYTNSAGTGVVSTTISAKGIT